MISTAFEDRQRLATVEAAYGLCLEHFSQALDLLLRFSGSLGEGAK